VKARFGSTPRRILAVAALCGCGAVAAVGVQASAVSDARPQANASGEDSPWPRTEALPPNVRVAQRELERLEEQVELMEQSAENYEDWQVCLTYVPVNELGDRDRQSGYLYDERDGTGVGYMDALAVDRRRKWGREDYLFIHFRGAGCRSDNPQPGGTAEPASVRAAASARRRARPGLKGRVTMLERKAERLFQRAQRLETISERFDEWESCVSWVPVTEYGDPDERFGYLFGPKGGLPGYRTALHIDRSDWDDPDYMFLALVGGDRPGRTCQDEPGEAVD
jgi:hypothetical protein